MANIKFRLNNGNPIIDASIPQKISIRYKLGSKVDFRASIGFKILVDDWDNDKQVVKNRSHIINRIEINNLINNLRTHLINFDNKNRENGITPNQDDVKKYYKTYFSVSEPKKANTLFTFIDTFIENAKTKPNPITKKLVSKNTLKDYTLTKNTLTDFNNEVYKIDFDSITLDWYYDFIDWCNTKGFKMNYTGKHIKTLKTFMNNAFENGFTTNVSFKSRKFSVYKEETDSVYLNENELIQMWQLDLTNEPHKEHARDIFLIGSFTGLRVSDYNSLTENNFKTENNIKILTIKTQKTNQEVAIPIHPIVDMILNKYDGKPPKKITDQKLNLYIKQVAKDMELNDNIELQFNRAGKKVILNRPKHELITSHTARRSFCTNAYLSGMNPMDIMAISGHTTEKNFRKYIKVTAIERAVKMSEHPFFKNATTLKVV
jgi:integrase